MRERTVAIIDHHCRRRLADAGLPAGEEVSEPWPPEGIIPHELTHDLYRHYGSMVKFDDVASERAAVIERSLDVVAASLIQQRERIHDLCYGHVESAVTELCPADVHPDEWDLDGVEKEMKARFYLDIEIHEVEEDVDALVDSCWDQVEAALLAREQEFGLYTFLYHIRRIYLREIDEQWISHLKNIEDLRAGIGLRSYANRNPKNTYKVEGFKLFNEMWESISQTVLDSVLQMRLSEEDRRRAEEGEEYESTLTKASQKRERAAAVSRKGGSLDRLDAAAKAAVAKLRASGAAPSQKPGASAAIAEAARRAAKAQAVQPAQAPSVDESLAKAQAQALESLKSDKPGAKKSSRRKRRKSAGA
ncbi:hypothetical protein [Pseudenhygromyxa sp. WMMC2535]|uniref:hypothetical protein n=1 Tax=Pseudenhygromyxa sp. WMMC2535 TaxID=2712867 RepID=UPI0031F7FA2E